MTEYALVADVGGTRTRVALVDATGAIVVRHSAETLAREGREAVMNSSPTRWSMLHPSAEPKSKVWACP